MSNVYELPKQVDPLEEASTWLARLDRGLDEQETIAIQKWLDDDPRNSSALMEMARLWDKMDSLSRLADLFPQRVRQSSAPRFFIPAVAATLLLAVLLGFVHISGFNSESPEQSPGMVSEQIFQTAIGEFSTVNLSDGSQLTLNTNSLIRVSFSKKQRLLVLERGEVYVQVAHDKSRPLSVNIGGKFVQAVGTAFNLKITNDDNIELIVTEGKVLVGVINKKAAEIEVESQEASDSSTKVSVGERMLLSNADDEEAEPIKPEEIEVKLSWRGGNIVFQGESLEEALAEIERYTPVEFVIMDENLKKIHIVGMFKAGDVQGLLTTLTENFDISYQRVSDMTVILTNKYTKKE